MCIRDRHNTLLSPKSSSHSNSGGGGFSLKPRRSKSTQSVLSLRDAQASNKNESTTDEEVEYFSEDNVEDEKMKNDRIRTEQIMSEQKKNTPHLSHNKLQSPDTIDEKEERKSSIDRNEKYRAVSLPLPHLSSNDYPRETSQSVELQHNGQEAPSLTETKLIKESIINEQEQRCV